MSLVYGRRGCPEYAVEVVNWRQVEVVNVWVYLFVSIYIGMGVDMCRW